MLSVRVTNSIFASRFISSNCYQEDIIIMCMYVYVMDVHLCVSVCAYLSCVGVCEFSTNRRPTDITNISVFLLHSSCKYIYIYIYIYPLYDLTVACHMACPSVCPSVYTSVCLSVRPSVRPSLPPSVHPTACLSVPPPGRPSGSALMNGDMYMVTFLISSIVITINSNHF